MPSHPPQPDRAPTPRAAEPPSFRRFLTRGEVAILVGMLMAVFSLYMIWERRAYEPNQASALFAAPIEIKRSGSKLPVYLPITICAVASAALLMVTPTEKNRLMLGLAHGACGMVCVILALTRLAPLAGPITGLAGGILLTYGAIERYRGPIPPPGPQAS